MCIVLLTKGTVCSILWTFGQLVVHCKYMPQSYYIYFLFIGFVKGSSVCIPYTFFSLLIWFFISVLQCLLLFLFNHQITHVPQPAILMKIFSPRVIVMNALNNLSLLLLLSYDWLLYVLFFYTMFSLVIIYVTVADC